MEKQRKIILPITEKYRLELDRYSWALAETRKDKRQEGGYRWEQIRWFITLEQAFIEVRRRLVTDTDAIGVKEVIHAIDTSTEKILSAIERGPTEMKAPEEYKKWLSGE